MTDIRKMPGLTWNKKTRVAVLDCYLPGSRTTRRQKTVKNVTYQMAIKALAAFRQRMEAEASGTPPPISAPIADATLKFFCAYVEQWWEFPADFEPENEDDVAISDGRSADTRVKDWSMLKWHVLPFFGTIPITSIGKNTIRGFIAAMKRKKKKDGTTYSPATINTCLGLVKLILRHAHDREVVVKVPPIKMERVQQVTNEFDDHEWKRFVQVFDDREAYLAHYRQPKMRNSVPTEIAAANYVYFRRSKGIFLLEMSTGLRRGDLLNTEWTNIVSYDGDTFLKRISKKTGQPLLLPLTDDAVACIEDCRRDAIRSMRWVFTQQDGQHFSLTTLKRHFALAKALSGITRHMRFHDLRHSVGSRLASRGIDTAIVQDILGHASIVTTQRYARPSMKARLSIKAALSPDDQTVEAGTPQPEEAADAKD